MKQTATYYFEGHLSRRALHESDIEDVGWLLEHLDKHREKIEREISAEIGNRLRAEVDADIRFKKGSFEWFGWITVAWSTLEAMSTIGGAIALVAILGKRISYVLRRNIPQPIRSSVYTDVTVVSAFDSDAVAYGGTRLNRLLIYSILVTNLVSLTGVFIILFLLFKMAFT